MAMFQVLNVVEIVDEFGRMSTGTFEKHGLKVEGKESFDIQSAGSQHEGTIDGAAIGQLWELAMFGPPDVSYRSAYVEVDLVPMQPIFLRTRSTCQTRDMLRDSQLS